MRRLGCPLSKGAHGFAHPEPIGVTPLCVGGIRCRAGGVGVWIE